MLYEQYRDDLLNRYFNHSFTETTVGSATLVQFFHSDAIVTVSDSSGTARFEAFAYGPTLVVGSEVVISGYATNTAYNGSYIVSATDGSTYFEVASIAFGTVELSGSVAALIAAEQKVELVDAYRRIREDLVGLRSEVLVTVTEAQRDLWTGTPYDGEGPIFNTDGTCECYDGTNWIAV